MEIESEEIFHRLDHFDSLTVTFPTEWNCSFKIKVYATMRITELINSVASLAKVESLILFYDQNLQELIP